MKKVLNTVDLFCGAGGASTGMELALDRLGLVHHGLAINHWCVAVDTMRANHPFIDTMEMDIENAVPSEMVPGGEVDLLWASPSCTHHSRAKGGKPRDRQLRAQPELVHTWLDQLFVRRLIIENVPEFVLWGPLTMDKKPMKQGIKLVDAKSVYCADPGAGKIRVGACFRSWLEGLVARNYIVQWKIVNCADFGDATSRKRFFLKAVRRGCGKIRWPQPTHAKDPAASVLTWALKKWRGIKECLDMSDLGKSIFLRKKPLAKNTLRRIAVGLRRYNGIDFQMDMLGADKGDESRVRPLTDPLPPQHAGGNRSAIVRPFIVRLNKCCDAESVEEPLSAVTAGGQHHALCTPFIVRSNRGCFAESVDAPLSSQQASTVHHALCQPLILDHFRNGEATDGSGPLGAQTTHDRYSVVTPFIVNNNTHNAPRSLDEPCHALTTGNHAMLCTPLVLGQQSGAAARPADEPCPTIATAGAVRVATPVILDMSRPGGNDSGHIGSAEEPIRTITTFDNVQVAIPLIFDKAVGLPRLPDGRYLDIRIRMLKPSELAAAHSFPPDYKLTGNRGEQVKQIGNSVPVLTAAAMCQADLERDAA